MFNIILGIAMIGFGVFWLVQGIINRNKVISQDANGKIVIINQDSYLKLQLCFSIFESIYLIVLGTITFLYNIQMFYLVIGMLLFFFLESRLKVVGKKKGYITYNEI